MVANQQNFGVDITIDESLATGQQQMDYITPYDLHKRWNRAISLKTLANWRSLGYGPPYSKFGGRVLYRVSDVLFWENQNRYRTKM